MFGFRVGARKNFRVVPSSGLDFFSRKNVNLSSVLVILFFSGIGTHRSPDDLWPPAGR